MREIGSIGAFVGKLFADVTIVKMPAAAVAGALAYVLPSETMRTTACATLALIVLDTITGAVAAKMSGQPISSAKFGRCLVKILAYGSVVVVTAIANREIPLIPGQQAMTVSGVLSLIVMTEGISVIENVRRMGFGLPFGIDRAIEERIRAGAQSPSVAIVDADHEATQEVASKP